MAKTPEPSGVTNATNACLQLACLANSQRESSDSRARVLRQNRACSTAAACACRHGDVHGGPAAALRGSRPAAHLFGAAVLPAAAAYACVPDTARTHHARTDQHATGTSTRGAALTRHARAATTTIAQVNAHHHHHQQRRVTVSVRVVVISRLQSAAPASSVSHVLVISGWPRAHAHIHAAHTQRAAQKSSMQACAPRNDNKTARVLRAAQHQQQTTTCRGNSATTTTQPAAARLPRQQARCMPRVSPSTPAPAAAPAAAQPSHAPAAAPPAAAAEAPRAAAPWCGSRAPPLPASPAPAPQLAAPPQFFLGVALRGLCLVAGKVGWAAPGAGA